jgi:hypothetical protein
MQMMMRKMKSKSAKNARRDELVKGEPPRRLRTRRTTASLRPSPAKRMERRLRVHLPEADRSAVGHPVALL